MFFVVRFDKVRAADISMERLCSADTDVVLKPLLCR